MGAIYLEKGFDFTRKVIVERVINIHLDVDAMIHQDWNFKSKLIDWGQKERHKVSFETVNVKCQNKDGSSRREYEILTRIDGQPAESAIEYSIKAAEQLAAEKTYKKLVEQGVITQQEE